MRVRIRPFYSRHKYEDDREDATADDPKQAIMSVLDYSKFFYTIPVHPDSQYLTCFIVPGSGSYLFRGVPMGMKISPQEAVNYARRRLGTLIVKLGNHV